MGHTDEMRTDENVGYAQPVLSVPKPLLSIKTLRFEKEMQKTDQVCDMATFSGIEVCYFHSISVSKSLCKY